MRRNAARALLFAGLSLWLAGCVTDFGQNTALDSKPSDNSTTLPPPDATASPETTGTVPEPLGVPVEAEKGLLGSDPNDELALGKKEYRANNFGLAEKHFQRAVELHPRDAESWLGLAAAYDRLRRFDLADRAYAQAIKIIGPTIEVLNNQGYSYMLRGDYKHAREKLTLAQRKDPANKYVANNLRLLDESFRKGKAIE